MQINNVYNWLARDRGGKLCAFVEEPKKTHPESGLWNNIGGSEFVVIKETDATYSFVKWSDEKSTPINFPKEDSPKLNNKPEMVNKPLHYIGINGLEVEKVLQEFIPKIPDSYIGHRVGSATEYILRAYSKNGLEDIEKAIKNLQQVVEYEKRNAING